ncbi:MAG TPA: methyltransferase domain-containing protein [Candidatus Acidoferrum sp.]|nr:methyltransferase domain-containing protein [Candidatus Acidoferrum sp.]
MSTSSITRVLSPAEGYKVWAATYDHECNPMLSLEQRVMERILPPLKGMDVVDLGCGTGRWLDALKKTGARSLLGIDPSPEMLSEARRKLGRAANFLCADLTTASIDPSSADVVLCSFVLSYLDDLSQFLHSARRILRPGGTLFISDVHPETSRILNWRRGVRVQNEFQEIRTQHRAIQEVVSLCRKVRLELDLLLEPIFTEPERTIFEENGKAEYFRTASAHPAIYILQLSVPKRVSSSVSPKHNSATVGRLRGGRIAFGPMDSLAGDMEIAERRVRRLRGGLVGSRESLDDSCVDLEGYLVLPGLVNAHDHLEFALFPRMGKGGYTNFLEWAEDIHLTYREEIALHRKVPKDVRMWWGGIRNLLCGVTTVCHHNPYDPDVFTEDFVVRVLRNFGWAHSLALDPQAAMKKKTARKDHPFFIHLAEGLDESSAEDIFKLHKSGALDKETVIIHGLGMDARGSALLRASGAGLVWCPSSNLFLFGRTLHEEQVRNHSNVALGSDSPLTANGDLLDEIGCAHLKLKARATDLYDYVIRQAAKMLRMKRVDGGFRVGGLADVVAVRDTGLTPAETLVSTKYQQVELVMVGGRIQLASEEIKRRLPEAQCAGLQPLSVDGAVRWIRAPLNRLFSETKKHLGEEILLHGRCLQSAS